MRGWVILPDGLLERAAVENNNSILAVVDARAVIPGDWGELVIAENGTYTL